MDEEVEVEEVEEVTVEEMVEEVEMGGGGWRWMEMEEEVMEEEEVDMEEEVEEEEGGRRMEDGVPVRIPLGKERKRELRDCLMGLTLLRQSLGLH